MRRPSSKEVLFEGIIVDEVCRLRKMEQTGYEYLDVVQLIDCKVQKLIRIGYYARRPNEKRWYLGGQMTVIQTPEQLKELFEIASEKEWFRSILPKTL